MEVAAGLARRLENDLAHKRSENLVKFQRSCAALFFVLIAYVMAVAQRFMFDTDPDPAWYTLLGEYCLLVAGILLLLQLLILRMLRIRRLAPTTPTPAGASLVVQRMALEHRVQTLKVDVAHERSCSNYALGFYLAALVLVVISLASHGTSWAWINTWPTGVGMVASLFSALFLVWQGLRVITAYPPPDLPPAGPLQQPPPVFWPPPLTFPSEGVFPPAFVCPITHEPMANPATTPRGTTYDREALIRWISLHQRYPGGEVRAAHSNHTPAPRTACAPLTPRY